MLKKLTLLILSISLVSCAATRTYFEKKDLSVNTTMSDSIFLEPTGPNERTIYVRVRNTSSSPQFKLQPAIIAGLISEGFKITNDPNQANFLLQANVRQFTSAYTTGDHDAGLGGVAAGGALGSAFGGGNGKIVGAATGALIGGLGATVVSATTKDVIYTAIVDIQLAQRTRNNDPIAYSNRITQRQGSGNSVGSRFSTESSWIKYRTLLTSRANKVNLTKQEAAPAIITDIVNSLSGLF
ncbi:MAG: hypothetical protein GY793_10830 [Proteobacteria bacterium]|nr:hypothetical protein [Pseudomonadota bacterium]